MSAGTCCAKGGAIDWCLLQIDQEDALVLEFLEQVALAFARRLTSEQDTADVPEEVVVLAHVDEIEIAVERARWRLGDEQEIDRCRLVAGGRFAPQVVVVLRIVVGRIAHRRMFCIWVKSIASCCSFATCSPTRPCSV